MKRQLLLIFLFIGISWPSFAFHIVGGDFSYRHISGDTYELKMKMYRDCGGSGANFDGTIRVGIYDKVTNARKTVVNMPLRSTYQITFNTFCINPELRCVETGIYTAQFNMPPGTFNNTAGYYLSWERCCRNEIIKNIVDPDGEGMAFYMELPSPYPGGGDFFYNNSPEFTRDPLNYLCVGEPFYYDFKTVDIDGDELRYSLIPPLAGGFTSPGNPGGNTFAGPYTNVTWMPGYGISNVMDGNPDLQVQADKAVLTITPQQIGVYVISVLCEEFRGGVKIGEIRRELQLEVIVCPPRFRPEVHTDLTDNVLDVRVGQPNCFNITGTDDNASETIRFRVDTAGMNFIFSQGAKFTPTNVAGFKTISTEFCWTPTCPIDTGRGSFIDIIIYDNGCPFSLEDTVRVKFNYISTVNNAPTVKTDKANNIFTVQPNQNLCFQISGFDTDISDQITLEMKSRNLDLLALGAVMTPDAVVVGNQGVNAEFCWERPCEDLGVDTVYLGFVISDNSCPKSAIDSIEVKIALPPMMNSQPQIFTSGKVIQNDSVVVLQVNEPNCFLITGFDPDAGDNIGLKYALVNYDIFSHGATFTPVTNNPNSKIYELCWTPSCTDVQKDGIYIDFLVRDNKCMNEKYDTVRMKILIQDADNHLPVFYEPVDSVYSIVAGYSLSVPVAAYDLDPNDRIFLSAGSLILNNGPGVRAEFEERNDVDSVRSVLNIFTDCSLNSNQLYRVNLYAVNEVCDGYDTVMKEIRFKVEPIMEGTRPLVPTAFSPNGDGEYDVFKAQIAARAVCPDKFSITIYDRWGKQLFTSTDPQFEWDGDERSPGAYVYVMKFGDQTYTGFVALIR